MRTMRKLQGLENNLDEAKEGEHKPNSLGKMQARKLSVIKPSCQIAPPNAGQYKKTSDSSSNKIS